MTKQEEKLWVDFLQAIRDDNEDQVKIIISSGGGKSQFLSRKISTTQGTLTALHLAVKCGNENIIKLLLERGADVNAIGHHGCTALHIAVDKDENRIIQLLLSQTDIDVDTSDEVGNTAIHVAADKGHYEVLQLLLAKAVTQNPGIVGKQNKDKNTPLHLAVKHGFLNCVALLLRYGAATSLELENRFCETPKQLAAGNKAIIELLENPAKALETRPVVKRQFGRGGSVEADSEQIPPPTNALLATGLPQGTVMFLTTPQVTIHNEYKTAVHHGGYAAIGPGSQLHTVQAPVMPGIRPQLHSTAESSFNINISGGHASIGDHSVTNVGTTVQRTSLAATTTEPEHPENRDSGILQTLHDSTPKGTGSRNCTEEENTPEKLSCDSSDVDILLSYQAPSGLSVVNPALQQERIKAAKKSGMLDFSHVGLSMFSPELLFSVNYHFLTKLNLSHNALTDLPELIGDLINLTHLFANDNQLSLLPRTIKQLQQLQELDLRNNKLKSVFKDITDLIRLKSLSVEGNPLTLEEVRSLMELVERRPCILVDIAVIAPAEIQARGPGVTRIYKMALRDGYVNVYRGRIMLIGQDRAGKTSLKKYLLGLPFDPKEESTVGIDPSTFEIHADRMKNWCCDSKNKTLLSEYSRGIARVFAEEKYLSILSEGEDKTGQSEGLLPRQESKEKVKVTLDEESRANQVANDADRSEEANISTDHCDDKEADCPIGDGDGSKEANVFSLESKIEMPSDVTKQANACLRQMFLRGHQAAHSIKEDSIVTVDLWDFAGQHLYYASHPVFFSPRAVYVLVHNLSKSLNALAEPCVRQGAHETILENPNGETNLENLLSWLVTVHRMKPRGEVKDESERQPPYLRPPVIIVGTHADKPFEDINAMTSQIQRKISGEEYEKHVIRPLFNIDNTQGTLSPDHAQSKASQWTERIKNFLWQDPQGTQSAGCDTSATAGDGIDALKDTIMKVLRREPYMGEKIPIR